MMRILVAEAETSTPQSGNLTAPLFTSQFVALRCLGRRRQNPAASDKPYAAVAAAGGDGGWAAHVPGRAV